MTRINDQVNAAMAFSLGQTDQVVPSILLDTLQPVLQADDYRKFLEVLTLAGNVTAAAGAIEAVFDVGPSFSWLIETASIVWGGTDFLTATVNVVDRSGEDNLVASVEVQASESRVIVGAGAVMGSGVTPLEAENQPPFIFVPSDGILRFDATRKKVDDVGAFAVRFIALRTPPVKRFDLREPDMKELP